jgi:hypothetical protein
MNELNPSLSQTFPAVLQDSSSVTGETFEGVASLTSAAKISSEPIPIIGSSEAPGRPFNPTIERPNQRRNKKSRC